MGYASAYHLPYIDNYAEAVRTYENIKPIRGSDNRRPLGRRRDHTTYHVRMTSAQDVELVVYQTPVITFKPDGTVVIKNGNWVTNTTHEFIRSVLRRVDACGWRGRTKLTVAGETQLIYANEEVVLVAGDNTTFKFQTSKSVPGYAMDRKAANNVRRRHAEFRAYFDNFIKLRVQVETTNLYSGHHFIHHPSVAITRGEIADVLGFNSDNSIQTSLRWLGCPVSTRAWYRETMEKERPAQVALFLHLIDPAQPEEQKHANFYVATLALLLGDAWRPILVHRETPMHCAVEAARQRLDTALMMAHAKEVLKVTMLEGGKTPNPKYDGWITE